jgi:YebC/PmpR family DNA-binding regulatory protein
MAGHSKWANIKHRKAAQDSKRSKVFTKILKKLSSAARRGGGDVDTNAELRLHVQKARAANVPADTVKRAILKATGQLEGVSYEDFSYEGYGPGGVAIMLEGTTDNRNRIVANVRHAFSKTGGNLGENGCVAWMFQTQGVVSIAAELVSNEDELF